MAQKATLCLLCQFGHVSHGKTRLHGLGNVSQEGEDTGRSMLIASIADRMSSSIASYGLFGACKASHECD